MLGESGVPGGRAGPLGSDLLPRLRRAALQDFRPRTPRGPLHRGGQGWSSSSSSRWRSTSSIPDGRSALTHSEYKAPAIRAVAAIESIG
jgi:hypothetical protein